MWAYMGEVVFATSLHVGICRMGTTLLWDDIAQKSHKNNQGVCKRISKGKHKLTKILYESRYVM